VAFRKKSFSEKIVIEKALERLQDLYRDTDDFNLLADAFIDTANILSRQPLESLQFQGILSVIGFWRGDKSFSRNEERMAKAVNETHTKQCPEPIHRLNDKQVVRVQTKDLPPLLTRFSFLCRRQEPEIHKILLVGPEGSAKSHTCEQIALHVQDDTQGMHSVPDNSRAMWISLSTLFYSCTRHLHRIPLFTQTSSNT
jgi:hypothetical protein